MQTFTSTMRMKLFHGVISFISRGVKLASHLWIVATGTNQVYLQRFRWIWLLPNSPILSLAALGSPVEIVSPDVEIVTTGVTGVRLVLFNGHYLVESQPSQLEGTKIFLL